ncbi:MAG: hypothetical protein IH944_12300 [Armatimonadetes bacterium]|nr:hypothetical protein [Armatimonadota bacterium]
MRIIAVLVLVGVLLTLLGGCSAEVSEDEAESDQLDIEVGRTDRANGITTGEPE